MLPKCTRSANYISFSKNTSENGSEKSSAETKHENSKWRGCSGVASTRKTLPLKFGFVFIVAFAALVQQSSGFNHGKFSNGDPAPGRSPGPPSHIDSDEIGGSIVSSDFETDPDHPTIVMTANVDESAEVSTDEPTAILTPHPETASVLKSEHDAVLSQNGGKQTADSECAMGDLDGVSVQVVEEHRSHLNLSIQHFIFKSETELVKGVTYEVILMASRGLGTIRDFTLETSINGEERGGFSTQYKDDIVCIKHDNSPLIPSPHISKMSEIERRKQNGGHKSPTKGNEYDINTERNDISVWDTFNVDANNNNILERYKLENDKDEDRKSSKNDDVKMIESDLTGVHKMADSDVHNSKIEQRVNSNVSGDVSTNDSFNPSLNNDYNIDVNTNNNDSKSIKINNQRKRDATNFINYPNGDKSRSSGFFAASNTFSVFGGNSIKKEVVKGHRVYGKINSSNRQKVMLNWQLTDSRLGEKDVTNVTFRLRYRISTEATIYEVIFNRQLRTDCQLSLYRLSGRLSWSDLPTAPGDCQIFFPSASAQRHGLLVTLDRLNVPCLSGGFIRLSPGTPSSQRSRANYQQTHLCGKLEELPESERNLYFTSTTQSKTNPYLHVHGSPLFVISYRLVDYCYNVTLTARNGSYDIEPTNTLHCTFRIHLPFGNRVALRLQMGEKPLKPASKDHPESLVTSPEISNGDMQEKVETEFSSYPFENQHEDCSGMSIKLSDGDSSWVHCSKSGDPLRNVQIISKQNSIVLYVKVSRTSKITEFAKSDIYKRIKEDVLKVDALLANTESDRGAVKKNKSDVIRRSVQSELIDLRSKDVVNDTLGLFLKLWYHAEPVSDIVGQCSYGWVSLGQFCVSVFENTKLPWAQAEAECVRQGGHLVSIRSEQDQAVVDQLLLSSPGYREHSAYWIGASDRASEGDFRWTDGLPFTFTHWFPGWESHGGYNRQPNDDGLSSQDCVEVRRAYGPPAPARPALSASHRWNDRDCGAPNHFVCERPLADEPSETGIASGAACESSVSLGRGRPRAALTSPGFPRSYPDGAKCDTQITAPKGYRIVIDFEELVLEREPDCSYDYLELWEPPFFETTSSNISNSPEEAPLPLMMQTSSSITSPTNRQQPWPESILSSAPLNARAGLPASGAGTSSSDTNPSPVKVSLGGGGGVRLCGDWSARLKLLRHVSRGPRLHVRFMSDYSHHYTGFKATLTMENAMECSDDRQKLFNDSCYLIVSYPEVTWSTAHQICRGARAQLASVLSPEEQAFITSTIRNSAEYSNSAVYWLGGKMTGVGIYEWSDGKMVTSFSGWPPGRSPAEMDILDVPDPLNPTCLGVQWETSPTPSLPSGLYWTSRKCSSVGGYVCKRKNLSPVPELKMNGTVNDTEGRITSPNYPLSYPNNMNYEVLLSGPDSSRLVVQFSKIDMEYQKDCLYDYVEVRSVILGVTSEDPVRWCGRHDAASSLTASESLRFVSSGGAALVSVRSDHSSTGVGFSGRWRAVDVSACPRQTLTARRGVVKSPNYPHFMLAGLECSYTILAPPGKRIWLEITEHDIDIDSTAVLDVDLGGDETTRVRPFTTPGRLGDGAFLSNRDVLVIRLRTGDRPTGTGFTAIYKTVGYAVEERIIELGNATRGTLLHVNGPLKPPATCDLRIRLVAPPEHTILLIMYGVVFNDGECELGRGKIEVFDSYADSNGTRWGLCEAINGVGYNSVGGGTPLSITSYLSSLTVRQKSDTVGVRLNATVSTQLDVNYRTKMMQGSQDASVESCHPNPCLNGGKCLTTNGRSSCQCFGHFTGMFCALTACELEPCVFGSCVLTGGGHMCACRTGYTGASCESRVKPCESKPCEGRGKCIERPSGFHCSCYAWWEGTRCERRMMNIPYKPLSERMLQEPFWLGLITVFVVLAAIGLVWCAKRHFPEKIEKLLAEEADRNRPNPLSLRGSSARDGGLGTGSATALAVGGVSGVSASGGSSNAGSGASSGTGGAPGGGPGGARSSLFNRLGIRKPSILSLANPLEVPASRTFSLDDLLRPPPRRTPSPRKKRNNSTPTKKNAAEKKQILQQLISPATTQNHARKVSMCELIQLSERRARESEQLKTRGESEDNLETSFVSGEIGELPSDAIVSLGDPKLEKKVTFARLLNKVSAEMSSGSEIEITAGSLLNKDMLKSASTPPSPHTDTRSPHSTSSNQGSDMSMSSLEAVLPGMGLRKYAGRANKISSADSILAMFRNFSSTAAGTSGPSSIVVSPSTTPSASSPQDDAAGDDDSTTSSIHTPVSFSSGPCDSPVFYRQSNSQSSTIEVPVLDVLSAHRASISGGNLLHPPTILLEIPSSINKCLSPIRELPTPLPSPALTPVMHRCTPSPVDYDDISDDHISMEIPGASFSQSEDDEDDASNQDISVIPRGEALVTEPTESPRPGSNPSLLKLKMRPPPIGRDTPTPSTQTTDDTPSPTTHSHDSERELSSSCGRATASPGDLSPARPALIIPLLTVEQPSPTRHYPTGLMFAGSPPPQRASIGETSFHFPNKQQQKRLLKEFDKPTSLDLAVAPPLITITCNMSEAESDGSESVSPAIRNTGQGLAPPGPSTMCYLSPFSMCTRGDRTTSESNLSSSGYSSMASPGPSRCGSNNPLCPSEMEDPGSGSTSLHPALGHRRPSPLLKTNSNPGSGGASNSAGEQKRHCRGRSDSETLSDDPLLESNDEGISTDHLEERIEDGELKSAKELEVFLKNEAMEAEKTAIALLIPPPISSAALKSMTKSGSMEKGLDRLLVPGTSKMSLQLPSIVIQTESGASTEKLLSPVSSRSESPLSDRTIGLGRFSPHFYGRNKDQLPFTDSDGLYDFPSSDCVVQNNGKGGALSQTQTHRKSTGRRRERKNSRTNTGSKTPSPTKAQLPHSLQNLLDVPGKDPYFRTPAPRKLSPKRRSRSQQPVSSSSSSESVNSAREVRLTPEAKSPNTDPGNWPKQEWAAEASGEDTGEDASARMLPKSPVVEEAPKPVRKISRMRTIGHQIRFLRRLEQSLKQREKFAAVGNSDEEGDESSSVTSPLLQQSKNPRPQIRKSSSVGRMQPSVSVPPSQIRPKMVRQKKGATVTGTTELLLSQDNLWRGSLGMAGPNDISD